jgi:hypothetical protein
MACFKFCQLSIEIVLLASRLLRGYHNFPVPADLDAGDVHTRCSNAFDGPSQVSLAEGGDREWRGVVSPSWPKRIPAEDVQRRKLPARFLTPSLGRAMLQRTTIFCDAI